MRLSIDISVFASPDSAIGRASGTLDLSALPRIGETVSFMFNQINLPFPSDTGFGGLLKVQDIIHSVGPGTEPALALESINANSVVQAHLVMEYLEAAFGLFAEPYL